MFRILPLIALNLLSFTFSFSQDTIVSLAYVSPQPTSYFEDRDADNYFTFLPGSSQNLWQMGKPSKSLFSSAYSPDIALLTDSAQSYPGNNRSSFEFVVKTDDYTFISFWHRYDTDSLKDGGVVEISTDGGGTWTNIVNYPTLFLTNFYLPSDTIASNGKEPGFSGNSGQSSWVNSTIEGYALDYMRFRFTFSSDSLPENRDGWMIDNFDFVCFGTGISDAKPTPQARVFPNPFNESLNLESEQGCIVNSLRVYDGQGRLFSEAPQPEMLSTSTWPAGVYFAEIHTSKGRLTQKIVKSAR